MAALLAPFGMCAEWLNSGTVSPLLAPCVKIALQFVKGLSENEFKDKVVNFWYLCAYQLAFDVNLFSAK